MPQDNPRLPNEKTIKTYQTMKIFTYQHENVKQDGTFIDQPGSVVTEGRIMMSEEQGGCNIKTCHCSDGHWISITEPRTPQGIVKGVTVVFDDYAEMKRFFKNRFLLCNQ